MMFDNTLSNNESQMDKVLSTTMGIDTSVLGLDYTTSFSRLRYRF
jgi:hypothetical protein